MGKNMVGRLSFQYRFRAGFTLIELLVVLGIITALSGLALSYVDNLNTGQRKDRTTQRLDELETLLHGDGQNGGAFLSDMGRLPIARELSSTTGLEEDICTTDATTGWIMPSGKILSELWDGTIFKFPYAIPGDETPRVPRPFLYYRGYDGDIVAYLEEVKPTTVTLVEDDYPKITLECGWKGPYLNVQPGKNYYDGFGNDFRVNVDTGRGQIADLLWPRDTVLEVGSFGENAEADRDYWLENPTEEEVEWQHRDDLRKLSETRIFATLVVRILVRNYSGGQMTWGTPQFYEDSYVPVYVATETYTDADVVRSTDSDTGNEGDLFRIVRGGMTTGGGTLKRGNALVDAHGNEWQWTPYTRKFSHLRAAVFSPAVDEKPSVTIDGEEKKYTGMRVTTAQFAKWSDSSGGTTVTRNAWGIGDPSGSVPSDVSCRNDFFAWVVPPNNASDDLSLLYEAPTTRAVDGQNYPQHSPEPVAEGETPGEVCFSRLTPGVRKLFVYGYLFNDLNGDGAKNADEPYSQAVHSGIQTIELKPGVNFVTIYLSEDINEFLP
ncbi:MAG: type II secretion system protein [Planctomycetia bacterium]|nr:type II secretion system protein [Planctomycetia bacterium]